MKFCKRCETDKEEKEFSKSRCTKDKLQLWCKSCMSFYNATDENKVKFNLARKKRRRQGYYQKVEKFKNFQYRHNNIELYLWKTCKERAKKYNIPFSITVEDIIVPELCPLLEIPLVINMGKASDNSPTIDKIVPELGYTKGNVKIISRKANWMKSNATKKELQTFYKNIFSYL